MASCVRVRAACVMGYLACSLASRRSAQERKFWGTCPRVKVRPIHPDNEWPVRPDPEAEKALYAPPDKADNPAEQPKTQRDWKHTIKVYSMFAGIATLVFGFVYIADMFAGDEVGVMVSYLFTLAIGLLYIFIEKEICRPGLPARSSEKLNPAGP